MGITDEEIDRRYKTIKMTPDKEGRVQLLMEEARRFAFRVVALTPEGREQALSLTKIEEALFWSINAIAHEENEKEKK